ncbi:MAG: phosphoribosylglycinamide formyltransferase [Puniceicoccaceae bacterium TMED149]|jgi:formyltetrahydrofolate-dependent phosphoribosylglycinamide formyltransferase|nr:MAG: phosphoribosylglycinamide formyltransferase [Puniceicoccaceae bacterium TMED149]|tara:strand:+ start:2725 stop:3288 length:564 start_codon:yes stop_codon:yes gene_type:complete
MVKKNACIFISGKGSNLKNLIKKTRDYNFPINIKLVISNNKNAQGINYAKINSIPFLIINTKKRGFENLILEIIKKNKISLICLAGYMKIISKKFIREFRKKIINVHPSLLPNYKGLDTYNRVLKNKEKKTGCTIHFINEKLDDGKIINKKFFFINKDENLKTLKIKTQKLERLAYPEAIIKLYRNR